jgi:uncharacterized membrane protein
MGFGDFLAKIGKYDAIVDLGFSGIIALIFIPLGLYLIFTGKPIKKQEGAKEISENKTRMYGIILILIAILLLAFDIWNYKEVKKNKDYAEYAGFRNFF